MPDNKLTDSEIVKALECFRHRILNSRLAEKVTGREMMSIVNALDLINRLQAENEKNENIIRLADKTIETANAEIERLQNRVDEYNIQVVNQREQIEKYEPIKETLCVLWENMLSISVVRGKEKPTLEELAEAVDYIKAEAYKEVEDKITELFSRYAFLHSHADMARQDYIKADDGTEIEMQSVWDVFTLKKYGIADYDEMNRLQTNIELIEKGRLLNELEKDFRLLVKELVGEDQ